MKNLLKELRESEINISLDGENIKLNFGHKELPPALISKIKQNKEALVSYLKEHGMSGGGETTITPIPLSHDGYPLSSSQQRLWILNQLEEGLASYNITLQTELDGSYDIKLFEAAVFAVIRRHEILRTVFRKNNDGEIRQWILTMDEMNFSIEHKDFTGEEHPMNSLTSYLREDTVKTFDLENGPLLRAAFLKTAPDRYVFHYNMHHIIGDGWSMGVLARDVIAYYKAFTTKEEVALPSLAIQYKDYAAWQLGALSKPENERHKEYWLNILSGELPIVDLPADKTRPSLKTQNGYTLETYLSSDLTNSLKRFTSDQGSSLFITLLTLWEVLIYRYTGQEDIIMGSPVSGRNHSDLENQIGFYVNTIALRNRIDPDDSFLSHYKKVKQQVLSAFSHQTYPFEKLLDDLKPKRDVGRSAIFDVMIVLQNTGEKIDRLADDIIPGRIYGKGENLSKLDMEINCAEVGDNLFLSINFNTDVYNKRMVESLMNHFIQSAAVLLSDPTCLIKEFNFLSFHEKHKMLEEFNAKRQYGFNASETIIDLFRKQAITTPDSIAVEFNNICLTYKQLDEQSTRFANYLINEYDVQVNDLIGIKLYRSEWMLIVILGILKSGGTYVPMDPDYPEERLEYIKADSACKVCIDEMQVEKFVNVQEKYSTIPNDRKITPSDCAYAIYTSGSTGNPKGVLNHHAGLMNRLLWMQDYLSVDGKAVILQKTPYTFDVSVWELLLPVISGAKLIFAIPEGHKDPYYLQNVIEQKKVTIIHFVPSMLKIFLNSFKVSTCKSIEHVICSGEALPAKLVNEFKSKMFCNIHNLYGPTEAAIDVTAINLTSYDTEVKGAPIGVPIDNTNIYIVNDAMALQPVGVAGEILIGGVQVAYRYLNKMELTDSSFIKSPFKEGERVYKTGDLAKWNEDGIIYYLGRRDSQVKVRGHRIELDEIRAQLLLKPEIRDAIVTVYKKEDFELVAYVVSDESQNSTMLRKFLLTKIPDYEIPSYFIQLDALPLTSNGKVNTKALPSPENYKLSTGIAYVAPGNEIEEKLIRLFATGLGRNPAEIGIHDNFFDLGANSLKLVNILNEINKEFQINIKPVVLFQYATINTLVENVFTEISVKEEKEDISISTEIDSMIDLMEG